MSEVRVFGVRALGLLGRHPCFRAYLAAVGPDPYSGPLASTLQGAFDTVFYILAIYFGAVGIRRMRHALPSMLIGAACVLSVRTQRG